MTNRSSLKLKKAGYIIFSQFNFFFGHFRKSDSELNEAVQSKRKKCSFVGCPESKFKWLDVLYYCFPVSRKDICDLWITNCKNESLRSIPLKKLRSRVVCEKHFLKECFFSYPDKRKRLKLDAVPTLTGLESASGEGKESQRQRNDPCEQNFKDRVERLVYSLT